MKILLIRNVSIHQYKSLKISGKNSFFVAEIPFDINCCVIRFQQMVQCSGLFRVVAKLREVENFSDGFFSKSKFPSLSLFVENYFSLHSFSQNVSFLQTKFYIQILKDKTGKN